MKTKDLQKALAKVPNMDPADVTTTFKMFLEFRKEEEITKREIKRLDTAKEVLLVDIEKRYDTIHTLFTMVFDERKQSIDKFFQIIDQGIREKDKEMISMGLSSLSTVVASSPFSNIAELGKLIESGQKIEL